MLSVNLSMLCTQRGEFAKGIIFYRFVTLPLLRFCLFSYNKNIILLSTI
jgi:hypothetical protein